MTISDRPIVIFRLGSLGDMVVALPCLHAVVRAFPETQRLILTNAPVSNVAVPGELVFGDSLVSGCISYQVRERGALALYRLRRRLQAVGSRTLIYLTHRTRLFSVCRDVAFFRLCGFTQIIGAPLTRDQLLPRQELTGNLEYEAERLARCLADLGPIDLSDRAASWDLQLTKDEHAAAEATLAPLGGKDFIAINPGGKLPKNDWGDANWTKLLGSLSHRHPGLALVVVGAPAERDRCQTLAASWEGQAITAAGTLLPRQSAAVLRRAKAFLGHDSGPLHLAACVGTRSLGLFGDNNPPRRWHPYGPDNCAIHDLRGVEFITPDTVVGAFEKMLSS